MRTIVVLTCIGILLYGMFVGWSLTTMTPESILYGIGVSIIVSGAMFLVSQLLGGQVGDEGYGEGYGDE